jgi:hypothetical protein
MVDMHAPRRLRWIRVMTQKTKLAARSLFPDYFRVNRLLKGNESTAKAIVSAFQVQ